MVLTRSAVTLVVSFAVAASPAAAASVRVSLIGPDRMPFRDSTAWVLALPADSSAAGAAPDGVAEPIPQGVTVVELGPGLWTITATGSRSWVAPGDVRIVGTESVDVPLQAWPAARIRGRLSLDAASGATASDLSLVVRSPPEANRPVPRVAVECRFKGDAFACDVPAVPIDAVLRAPGHAAAYFWDLNSSAERPLDLGKVVLRAGGSLVGFVHGPAGGAASGARVTLSSSPLTGDQAGAANSPRGPFEPKSVTVSSERGFFQIVALPSGRYRVFAQEGGLRSTWRPVDVRDQTEYEVDPPLLLQRPSALDLEVTPPLDENGKQWAVTLVESSAGSLLPLAREALLSSDGKWTRGDLPAGSYLLSVEDGSANRSAIEEFVLAPGERRLVAVDLGPIPLHGSVRLGRDPLADAQVTLRGGPIRASFHTDRDGRFEGTLPRLALLQEAWRASVECDSPSVRRRLSKVEFASTADGGLEFDVRLGTSAIAGIVVDELGQPWAPKAIVSLQNLSLSTERVQTWTASASDNVGHFSFSGLEGGDYLLEAKTLGGSSSDQVRVSVKERQEESGVRLTMRRSSSIDGFVEAFDGTPVAGAELTVLPADRLVAGTNPVHSDAQGHFSIDVPEGTEAVLVTAAAAGYAYRMARLPIRGERVIVTLDRSGGALSLRHQERLEGEDGTYVISDGGFVGIRSLRAWAAMHGGTGGESDTTILPNLSAGRYAVCRLRITEYRALVSGPLPPDRCTSGMLPAGGTLDLTVPPPRSQPQDASRESSTAKGGVS